MQGMRVTRQDALPPRPRNYQTPSLVSQVSQVLHRSRMLPFFTPALPSSTLHENASVCVLPGHCKESRRQSSVAKAQRGVGTCGGYSDYSGCTPERQSVGKMMTDR